MRRTDRRKGIILSSGYCFKRKMLYLFLLLLYQGDWWSKLVMEIICFSLSSVVESAVALLVIWTQGSIDFSNRLYGVCSNIFFFLITKVLGLFFSRRTRGVRKTAYTKVLAGVALTTSLVVTFLGILNNRMKNEIILGISLAMVVILGFADIFGLKIYEILMEKWHITRKRERYASQLELCEKQMEERITAMQEVRRLRHDLKNQMVYLKGLVEEDPGKAREFIEESLEYEQGKVQARSGNLVVDSLVNYQYLAARERGIAFDFQLKIPAELPVAAADLCVVLGNLLDNAQEACQKCDVEKKIRLEMEFAQQHLKIRLENTFAGQLVKDGDGNYKTTKEDAKNHGIGLTSVRKCVETYGGEMKLADADGWFRAEILL